MNKEIRIYLFSFIAIAALTVSLFSTKTVQADDTTPPPATGEPVATQEPVSTDVSPAMDKPVAIDVPTGTDVPTAPEAPVLTTTNEAPAEPLTVPEVLDQLPDGTDLVVLDENGSSVPLATQTASNIFLTGDPMWCPDGVLPFGSGCTPQYASFHDLINDLENSNTGSYSGSGTIYVSHDYDASSTNDLGTSIIFDYGNVGLTDLVVQGGWDFFSNTKTGTTTIDGVNSVQFLDWGGWGFPGNLTLSDLIINHGDGLYISDTNSLDPQTTADVSLENVTVSNSNDGTYIGTHGKVSVTHSQFNNTSAGDGLAVESGGDVTVTRVTATYNDNHGINISASASITLTDVIAEHNGGGGALLESCGCNPGGIVVRGGSFSHNHGDGLNAEAFGNITLKNVTAVDNAYDGASLVNAQGPGDVSVSNSVFNFNGWDNEAGAGLDIYTIGNINISSVTASHNTFDGAFLDPTRISVRCSTFNDNGDTGLDVDLAGGKGTFNNIGTSGNSTDINIVNGSYTFGATNCGGSSNGGGYQPVGSGCNGETIVLDNEDRLIFQCPEAGHNQEEVLTQNNLPGPLPGKTTFVSGFTVHLILNGVEVMVSPDPQILQFKLPKGASIEDYVVLFWNGIDWVEVSGASITEDGYLQIAVEQEGTYALVHK